MAGASACLFMEGSLGVVRIGYKIDGKINWRFSFNAGAPVIPGFERHAAFTSIDGQGPDDGSLI